MEMCGLRSCDQRVHAAIPLCESSIKAGFPSPADNYIEKSLDFNEYLIRHPSATFCLRVSGDSMINAGIFSGDILVVDRSLRPLHDNIVVAILDGDMTVKRLAVRRDSLVLMPENDQYPPIIINDPASLQIWGVVTYVIHRL